MAKIKVISGMSKAVVFNTKYVSSITRSLKDHDGIVIRFSGNSDLLEISTRETADKIMAAYINSDLNLVLDGEWRWIDGGA